MVKDEDDRFQLINIQINIKHVQSIFRILSCLPQNNFKTLLKCYLNIPLSILWENNLNERKIEYSTKKTPTAFMLTTWDHKKDNIYSIGIGRISNLLCAIRQHKIYVYVFWVFLRLLRYFDIISSWKRCRIKRRFDYHDIVGWVWCWNVRDYPFSYKPS